MAGVLGDIIEENSCLPVSWMVNLESENKKVASYFLKISHDCKNILRPIDCVNDTQDSNDACFLNYDAIG